MAIERPSQQAVNQFIRTQEAKKDTGSWWGYTPYALLGVTAFGLFHHSLYWSMTPSGIVPRILYEKSLSLPRRHLRHLLPAAIAIGSLFIWDTANGLWSDAQ